MRDIVRYYTREAGVRASSARSPRSAARSVKSLLTEAGATKQGQRVASRSNLDKFLGVRRYTFGIAEKKNQVGQVTGLAWTEVGGELLTIEAAVMPGKGKTITTGKLGEVMQESIQAALIGGAQPLARARRRRGLLPEERHPHPPARGRDAQGRPERGHRHLHRDGVGRSPASRCAPTSR